VTPIANAEGAVGIKGHKRAPARTLPRRTKNRIATSPTNYHHHPGRDRHLIRHHVADASAIIMAEIRTGTWNVLDEGRSQQQLSDCGPR
jgi:hypothetical protein